MARLFGTDGVRGIANVELTCKMAFDLGQAGACVLARQVEHPTILVGRDTRISGVMLENALVAGILSVGGRALQVGILPTPAIAYMTRAYHADAGIVISASHNSMEFNGIKFFDGKGYKLPDEVEDQIEELIRSGCAGVPQPIGEELGVSEQKTDAQDVYISFLKRTSDVAFSGLRVVLDCAQGASYQIAPRLFKEMGAEVFTYYHQPNGTNINADCGSTHPESLQKLVLAHHADLGLAFDGDADRLIAVDDLGRIVDGDQIMFICAKQLLEAGKLANNTLVVTVMSNFGLDLSAAKEGIRLEKTAVGDRYVLENMLRNGHVLGGEQSGHVIFSDYNTTGDGMVTAIQLLNVLVKKHKKLSELADEMPVMPQYLYGVKVANEKKSSFLQNPMIAEKIREVDKKYQGKGRVLVRPSGTEPLIRIMIEGTEQEEIEKDVLALAAFIEERLA